MAPTGATVALWLFSAIIIIALVILLVKILPYRYPISTRILSLNSSDVYGPCESNDNCKLGLECVGQNNPNNKSQLGICLKSLGTECSILDECVSNADVCAGICTRTDNLGDVGYMCKTNNTCNSSGTECQFIDNFLNQCTEGDPGCYGICFLKEGQICTLGQNLCSIQDELFCLPSSSTSSTDYTIALEEQNNTSTPLGVCQKYKKLGEVCITSNLLPPQQKKTGTCDPYITDPSLMCVVDPSTNGGSGNFDCSKATGKPGEPICYCQPTIGPYFCSPAIGTSETQGPGCPTGSICAFNNTCQIPSGDFGSACGSISQGTQCKKGLYCPVPVKCDPTIVNSCPPHYNCVVTSSSSTGSCQPDQSEPLFGYCNYSSIQLLQGEPPQCGNGLECPSNGSCIKNVCAFPTDGPCSGNDNCISDTCNSNQLLFQFTFAGNFPMNELICTEIPTGCKTPPFNEIIDFVYQYTSTHNYYWIIATTSQGPQLFLFNQAGIGNSDLGGPFPVVVGSTTYTPVKLSRQIISLTTPQQDDRIYLIAKDSLGNQVALEILNNSPTFAVAVNKSEVDNNNLIDISVSGDGWVIVATDQQSVNNVWRVQNRQLAIPFKNFSALEMPTGYSDPSRKVSGTFGPTAQLKYISLDTQTYGTLYQNNFLYRALVTSSGYTGYNLIGFPGSDFAGLIYPETIGKVVDFDVVSNGTLSNPELLPIIVNFQNNSITNSSSQSILLYPGNKSSIQSLAPFPLPLPIKDTSKVRFQLQSNSDQLVTYSSNVCS